MRKFFSISLKVVTFTGVAILGAALTGQIVRDRLPMPFALLIYLPSLPIAIATLILDLLQFGRGTRLRFGLTIFSILAGLWSMWSMVGTLRSPHIAPQPTDLRFVQWNVRYGGGDFPAMENQLLTLHPNLIVFNEAPRDWHVKELLGRLGPNWQMCQFEKPWVRLVICSPQPVHLERVIPMRNGDAMLADTTIGGQFLRILVVDGVSNPRIPRTPFLNDIVNECEQCKRAGTPVDIVAGDFNSIGRSVGFDHFRTMAGDFELASDQCRGWVGTYPAWCPLYDIDHVWILHGFAITGCRFFGNAAADHRGQIITLRAE